VRLQRDQRDGIVTISPRGRVTVVPAARLRETALEPVINRPVVPSTTSTSR
jgi:hypothetical protein